MLPFHIGQSWGVNESTAYRIMRKVEDILCKSKAFTLPGKKKLAASNNQLKVVVIDSQTLQLNDLKTTKTIL